MKIELFKVSIDEPRCKDDQTVVNNFLKLVTVVKTDMQFVPDEHCWSIVISYESKKNAKVDAEIEEPLTEQQQYTFEMLKIWRKDKAASETRKSYMIASDRDLRRIARAEINDPEDLLGIKGFKEKKIAAYGEEIVALLNSI